MRWGRYMGICIQTPHLTMELRIIPLKDLYIHEETIPSALEQLKQELKIERVLKHPMIGDSETYVILDGMHRFEALKSLGYQLAPVCLVDYKNPAIELFAWYREFEGLTRISNLIDKIRKYPDYEISEVQLSSAIDMVNKRVAFSVLAYNNQAYLLKSPRASSIKEFYDEIARIEKIGSELGSSLIYSTESDAIASLCSSIRPVMIVPSLTKHEVTNAALQGVLFAHKTTRHVVPARPLFTNIPLSWLKSSDSKKANAKMEKHLKNKRVIRKDPGSLINGRRYEEFSFVFTE